jgi:hypothetical protein
MVPTVFLKASPVVQKKNLHGLFICRDALTPALTHVSSVRKAIVDSGQSGHAKNKYKTCKITYTTFF